MRCLTRASCLAELLGNFGVVSAGQPIARLVGLRNAVWDFQLARALLPRLSGLCFQNGQTRQADVKHLVEFLESGFLSAASS